MPRSPRFARAALVAALAGLLSAPPGVSARGIADLQAELVAVSDSAMTALVNIQPITESFSRGERRRQASVGSGFLISAEGYIVTNHHVAGRAKHLMVTLPDKERVEAELVGEDPSTDLAVIRIAPELVRKHGLTPLRWGDSDGLQVGHFVMALGSPLALARTMTFGIVSNKERYLPNGMTLPTGEQTGAFNTWIQTDAAINPGNSGGPLIDLKGRVVGVNARGAVFADNIGFAIPSRTAKRVVEDLIAHGEVRRSYVGITFQPLKDWAPLFGLDAPRGVIVSSVEPGSPGAVAGLEAGDLMLSYGDMALNVRYEEELPALHTAIAETPIGSEVPIRVLRRGEEFSAVLSTAETGKLMGEEFEAEAWGFAVRDITEQMAYDMELDHSRGVLVEGVRVGGPAERGKLHRDLVVEAVEDREIEDLAAFKAVYKELSAAGTKRILLRLRAYDAARLVLVELLDKPDGGTR